MKHSVKFFLTQSSGVKNIPDFVAVTLVNEVPVGRCDSIRKIPVATLGVAQKVLDDDPEHLQWYTEHCLLSQYTYKAQIDILTKQLNQTGGK